MEIDESQDAGYTRRLAKRSTVVYALLTYLRITALPVAVLCTPTVYILYH